MSRNLILIGIVIALLVPCGWRAAGECVGASEDGTVHALYQQQRWDEVIAAAEKMPSRSAEVDFELGMAQAHLQRWNEARAALLAGERQCSGDKRFPIELAGVAFQQKNNPEAARWIVRGLKIDPNDAYANDFAGTVFALMENTDAALKYWNRVQKPYIDSLNLDPELRVQRLLLERALVFSPQAVMKKADFESSEARLDGLGIFPAYSIKLDVRADGRFDAEFHAIERNGFGNGWLQSAVSVFSGLPYETIYPSYFNIGHSATNFESLARWDPQKRRVWLSLSGPMRYLPQWRWRVEADERDENWAIRRSFTGPAPVLGSFNLKREVMRGTFTSVQSGRLGWTSGAELSHRTYSDVMDRSALTPQLVAPGFELKFLEGVHAQLLNLPEHRFTLSTSADSEFARLWSRHAQLYEKLQGGATVHWFPQAEGDKYEFAQRVRGGGIAGTAPVDESWMVGVERDSDLWLRGHIGTRDGRKGSSPIANRFFLSNTDFYRSVWSNGLVSLKAGPLLDVAKVSAPTSGLAARQWLVDAGVEVKLSVMGTGVVLTYGRDLRTGNNAFYGAVAQK